MGIELSLNSKICNTTDEYIMEVESCIEQIKVISDAICGTNPITSPNDSIRIGAFGSALITLCGYCEAVIKNYYENKKSLM